MQKEQAKKEIIQLLDNILKIEDPKGLMQHARNIARR